MKEIILYIKEIHLRQGYLIVSSNQKLNNLTTLYLIGPYGYKQAVNIKKYLQTPDNNYAIFIDKEYLENINESYLLTNKLPTREDINNPYLHFLLENVNNKNYDYLDILFNEIVTNSYFIAPIDYQDAPVYKIDNKIYYPIYTNENEINNDLKAVNKKTAIYSFNDYSRMCLTSKHISGIIINPTNKDRNILLTKDIIEYIDKAKDKYMQQYLSYKKYQKEKNRRRKYESNYASR